MSFTEADPQGLGSERKKNLQVYLGSSEGGCGPRKPGRVLQLGKGTNKGPQTLPQPNLIRTSLTGSQSSVGMTGVLLGVQAGSSFLQCKTGGPDSLLAASQGALSFWRPPTSLLTRVPVL